MEETSDAFCASRRRRGLTVPAHAMTRKRLLLVDPLFHSKGGGPAVTFWALEALKHEYDVTVLTWREVDIEAGNYWFGTKLKPDEFRVETPLVPVRWLGELLDSVDKDPFSIQRWSLLMRTARHIAHRFDVVMTTNGEADFGVPSIQYIHFPYLANGAGDLKDRRLRRRPWQLISGFTFAGMKVNHALANSDWTSKMYESRYGVAARTLYPPVPGDFEQRPWEDREEGFVCIGRYNGDKRIELVIEILAAVRRRRPEVHLHLVGAPMPEEPGGIEFYQRLRRLVAQNSDWISLDEGISRDALRDLLVRHRYGIHAKVDEHFGIGVAELVRAGCVTFTHRSGGQMEIVNHNRLLFVDKADAVERILAVLEQPELERELQGHMARQAQLFSTEHFAEGLRQHVATFLNGSGDRCCDLTPSLK